MKLGGLFRVACMIIQILTKRKKKTPKNQKHNYEIHVREHGLDESIDFLKNDLVSDAHM